MPIPMLRLLASVLSLALIISTSATAEPKLEMHRVGVNVDDGSGWYLAVSTKGSFSILLPIPFNDFTTRDDAGTDVHGIGGKSSEGIKFTAVETPVTAKTPADLAAIPKSWSSDPANKVSDVSRNTKDDVDNLSFSVGRSATSMHTRIIRTKDDKLYVLTIEYPNAYGDLVAGTKDKFFGSFKLKGKS